MNLDALESLEGPTTLRIFLILLMLTVMLVLAGAVFSVTHGISFVKTIGLSLADNTEWLLNLAGVIAFLILIGKIGQIALKFVD